MHLIAVVYYPALIADDARIPWILRIYFILLQDTLATANLVDSVGLLECSNL